MLGWQILLSFVKFKKYKKGEIMTKINKFGKSTFMIAILSFVLVAVLAFGGTYAYFSAVHGRAAGTVKTGHLSLKVEDGGLVGAINGLTVASNTIAQPGQLLVGESDKVGKTLTATVNTNIDYYIRVKFAVSVTPGKYEDGVWTKAEDKKHDGVLTEDNLLTPDDPDQEGVQNNEETNDSTPGQGDNVADDISILNIFLKVDRDLTSTENTIETWTEHRTRDDDETNNETEVLAHTGYYYPTMSEENNYAINEVNVDDSIAIDQKYGMEVLINIQDWVGAYGCTYYMDAAIEIRFQIEVLQANYLDSVRLGGATWTGSYEIEEDVEVTVPGTIAELHDAWNAAIKFDQDAQDKIDNPPAQG